MTLIREFVQLPILELLTSSVLGGLTSSIVKSWAKTVTATATVSDSFSGSIEEWAQSTKQPSVVQAELVATTSDELRKSLKKFSDKGLNLVVVDGEIWVEKEGFCYKPEFAWMLEEPHFSALKDSNAADADRQEAQATDIDEFFRSLES